MINKETIVISLFSLSHVMRVIETKQYRIGCSNKIWSESSSLILAKKQNNSK